MPKVTSPFAVALSILALVLIGGSALALQPFPGLAGVPPLVARPLDEATIRYRETLYFTRNGTKTSYSGVTELTLRVGGSAPGFGLGVRPIVRHSEAIPIDVGNGNMIFALQSYPYAKDQRTLLLSAACDLPTIERTQDPKVLSEFLAIVTTIDRNCTVPEASWPILVQFGNRSDPYSLLRLLPIDLPAKFDGLKLERVTVALTQDPPTAGIETLLPWLSTGLPKGPVPIKTIEEQPRTNPIKLAGSDFYMSRMTTSD